MSFQAVAKIVKHKGTPVIKWKAVQLEGLKQR